MHAYSVEPSTEIFFACRGTHFFVCLGPPSVKLDHFWATQKKSRRALDNARRTHNGFARRSLDHQALDHLLVGLSGVYAIQQFCYVIESS